MKELDHFKKSQSALRKKLQTLIGSKITYMHAGHKMDGVIVGFHSDPKLSIVDVKSSTGNEYYINFSQLQTIED